MSIILEFFSFNGYVLDFGLEGGVLGLGLGLEVCVLGLALALGVMSLLTSLIVIQRWASEQLTWSERELSFFVQSYLLFATRVGQAKRSETPTKNYSVLV